MATPESKLVTTRQRSPPFRPNDIEVKPLLSDSEDDEISFSHQTEAIKIQRELLRELYQEKNSKLDLQEVLVKMKEENHLLKKGRRGESGKAVLKMEPGIERDIKPVIPSCGEPGSSGARDEVDNDLDEIVFLREVKGNAVNDITMSQVQTGGSQDPVAASSGSEAENLLNTVSIIPQDAPSPTRPPSSSPPSSSFTSFTRPRISWPKTRQRLKTRSGPKHISQKRREVSLSSSSSDPQSDASDDTYDTSSDESTVVPAGSFRGKRMKTFGLRDRKPKLEKINMKRKRKMEGKDDLEYQKKETRKEKKPASDGRGGTSDRSQETKSNADAEDEDLSSSEDESWNKYRGPRIKILSVKAINDRLGRTFDQYGLSIGTIDDLALWWPKTIVGRYHDFDTRHHYLLTRGVYEWWSRLCVNVNSPGHVWPDTMNEAKKTWLSSGIKEITCQKEGAAERGKREMMDDGDIVAADDEIDLDE